MRRLRDSLSSEQDRGSAAWSCAAARGLQHRLLMRARAGPSGTRRNHDRRLSPDTVTNGRSSCQRRVVTRSGTSAPLIAWGKQCVLSPRPSQCCPSLASVAADETLGKVEERGKEGGDRRRREGRTAGTAPGRGEQKERAQSSVAPKRERLTIARRPHTAPARAQTGRGDVTQPPTEAPSCRVVWRRRQGEKGHCDSPGRPAAGTPVLHLYLPRLQLPDLESGSAEADGTTEEEKRSSENARILENNITRVTGTSQQEITKDKPQQEITKDKPQQEITKDKPQYEITKDKPQQEITKDKPQQEITKDKPQQEITTVERQHDTEVNDQNDITDRNGEHCTGVRKKCDITADNEQRDIAIIADADQQHNRDDEKQELTEDKRQHDITQGALNNIIRRDENKVNYSTEEIRHHDYTEGSGEHDITKEHGNACDVLAGNRQQGCRDPNRSEDTDDITVTSTTEPDSEMTALPHSAGHRPLIKTHSSEKSNLSQTSAEKQERRRWQVLEKRGKGTPRRLGFGGVRVGVAWTQSPSSEAHSVERTIQPLPTVLFPSTVTPIASHTALLPHALPSLSGTFLGYRIGMFHIPELLSAKTCTTGGRSDERVIKRTRKLSRCPESTGNHYASRIGIREITSPHPKIMSSEWGSPPRKVKTTKTFVWGPWGPQETKSVCELHTHANRA